MGGAKKKKKKKCTGGRALVHCPVCNLLGVKHLESSRHMSHVQ